MLDSFIYGLLAASLVVGITRSVMLIYHYYPHLGYGLVYGSVGVKLGVIGAFTLLAKPYIDNVVVYAFVILSAIIYCNIYMAVKLSGK